MSAFFFSSRVILHIRILFQHDIPYSLILPLHHCPQSASFPCYSNNQQWTQYVPWPCRFFFSFRRFVLLACPVIIL